LVVMALTSFPIEGSWRGQGCILHTGKRGKVDRIARLRYVDICVIKLYFGSTIRLLP
jgi:hypothetical protein